MAPENDDTDSHFREGSPHHTGVKNALAKILDICRVKSKEVPGNRKKIEDLIQILIEKMTQIDPLFDSMEPGNMTSRIRH